MQEASFDVEHPVLGTAAYQAIIQRTRLLVMLVTQRITTTGP